MTASEQRDRPRHRLPVGAAVHAAAGRAARPACTLLEIVTQDRSATVSIAGRGFVQNLRRGRYELAAEELVTRRAAVAFDEFADAI